MKELLQRLKPAVSTKTHLFTAALLWTVIGLVLMGRGTLWLEQAKLLFLILPAIGIGFFKSRMVLDRVAQKILRRIMSLQDRSCLGAVYSVRTWLLAVAMMAGGSVLRSCGISHVFLGLVYWAIGWALFYSARIGWLIWLQQ